MAKLIQLKEAAELLGLTPEELTDLRSHGKVFGYRDGSTWKFKESELERLAAERGFVLGAPPLPEPKSKGSSASLSSVDADLDELIDVSDLDTEQDTDGPDSILVSEQELGASEPGASSTIIGKEQLGDPDSDLDIGAAAESAGSELDLDRESDILSIDEGSGLRLSDENGAGSSELKLVDEGDVSPADGGSEIKLTGDDVERDEDLGSELRLAAESGVQPEPAAGTGSSGSDLHAKAARGTSDSPSATGDLPAGDGDDMVLDSDTFGMGDDALELGDDELLLESDSVSNISLDASDVDIDVTAGTDVGLVTDPGSGSDVTLNAGDSGINLMAPSESGISLEEMPAELGGSGVEALELGEAEIVDLDDEDVDIEAATQLKPDDDFLLTPVEGALGEEAESGSQVIALDTEEFDESGDTMLAEAVAAPVMELDPDLASLPEHGAAAAPISGVTTGAITVEAPAEAPYSIWNVLGLGCVCSLLGLTGAMLMDLLRNMWSWNETYSFNSTLMDAILGLFGQ